MSSKNCKLVVLGDSGVGKTTLIHKFIENEFRVDFKATIGADFSCKTIDVDGQKVELQIWDTAGEERFHSVGAAFYRGTDACIIVYDCTQSESCKRIDFWRKDLFEKSDIGPNDDFPIVLFENKADLVNERIVKEEDSIANAKRLGYTLFSVSAKTGQNVELGFKELARQFLKHHKATREDLPLTITLDLNRKNTDSKSCC